MHQVRRHGDGERVVRKVLLMTLRASVFLWLVFSAAVALAGCTPSGTLNVNAIQTGKSLNSDNSVATHSTSFSPKDIMYVSVLTNNKGSGTITVRWTLNGTLLHEETKKVAYRQPAATDFRFQAADGFPAGDYVIDVLLDGKSVGMRRVTVG